MNEIAVIQNGTCAFINEDQLYDPDNYFFYVSLEIYSIPMNELTVEQEDEVYNGSTDNAHKIGEVIGMLFLGSQIKKNRIDIFNYCSDISEDAEYLYCSLNRDNGPLAKNKYLDIFWIDSIEMNEEYDADEYKEEILEKLPELLLCHYHIYPDIICTTIKAAHDEERSAMLALYKSLAFAEHSDTRILYRVCSKYIRK